MRPVASSLITAASIAIANQPLCVNEKSAKITVTGVVGGHVGNYSYTLTNTTTGAISTYNTPNITNMDDFKDHIGLSTIHIMKSDKEGLAYIGFEIGCTWDDEHGIGVMMHKDRVVSIGEADVAFSSWLTQIDNGTSVKNN